MFAMDALFNSAAKKGCVCIGLDVDPQYVPPSAAASLSPAESVLKYNLALIEATADVCACYKVQIAYYEALGLDGLKTYSKTLKAIREAGSLSIADVKRGDIAETAARYAEGHFSGDFAADFVTLSPYMGMDSLEPWMAAAKKDGRGAFVLMRTSNKGMRDFQRQELKEGGRLYNLVGRRLSELAVKEQAGCGYGIFGAVAGCTEREEAAEIRRTYKNLFFLIPGYGAQGAAADDAALFINKDGGGGVVNASRSIIKAWQNNGAKDMDVSGAALEARKAAIKMRDEIKEAVGRKKA
ncbi:MAG: orotidine-5'-phosphate decarboxylase [Spirochaetaceae bacterium]|jgi:orotidine-5'-phosphate decarboxylase|nr:orotidine-5'-phosphate decarboxylase [Spirochaetaceae bacterium]